MLAVSLKSGSKGFRKKLRGQIRVFRRLHIYIYIYIYIYTHTHTHIYTYTHTHTHKTVDL